MVLVRQTLITDLQALRDIRLLALRDAPAAAYPSPGPPRPRRKQVTASAELSSTAWAGLPWNASCGRYRRWRKNHPSQRDRTGKAADWPSVGTGRLPHLWRLPSLARLRQRVLPET